MLRDGEGERRSPTMALAFRVWRLDSLEEEEDVELEVKRSLYALTMLALRSMPMNSVAWSARMAVMVPGPQA